MPAIKRAVDLLHASGCSCAVITREKDELIFNGQGLAPIISLLKDNPAVLCSASVADKVIGKAAAMLLAYGGACEVWGDIMSKPALDFLTASNILASYNKLVPVLKNREATAQCPMEEKAQALLNAKDAYDTFVCTG